MRCKCQNMSRLIESAVDNVGRIITDLRPSILDHQGLWAALEWQAQEFVQSAELGLDWHLDVGDAASSSGEVCVSDRADNAGPVAPSASMACALPELPEPPGHGVCSASFRKCSATWGATRSASHLVVRIVVHPRHARQLSVQDDGVGAPPQAFEATDAYGIMGMRERARHLGGLTWRSRSTPGSGHHHHVKSEAVKRIDQKALKPFLFTHRSMSDIAPPAAQAASAHMATIRVLLGDDHRIVREGLKQVLADAPEVQVVAEAANRSTRCSTAVRAIWWAAGMLAHGTWCCSTLPCQGMDGLDVLQQPCKREPPPVAGAHAQHLPGKAVCGALHQTGCQRLPEQKCRPRRHAGYAVRKVAAGVRRVSSPPPPPRRWPLAVGQRHRTSRTRERCRTASTRCYRLLTQGLSVTQIGAQLGLAPNTVSTYRVRILEKTGTNNDVELALYAERHGQR